MDIASNGDIPGMPVRAVAAWAEVAAFPATRAFLWPDNDLSHQVTDLSQPRHNLLHDALDSLAESVNIPEETYATQTNFS